MRWSPASPSRRCTLLFRRRRPSAAEIKEKKRATASTSPASTPPSPSRRKKKKTPYDRGAARLPAAHPRDRRQPPYYWVDGARGSWVLEFTAISNVCGLPAHCGAYGVCTMANGDCGCLLDEERTGSDDGCLPADSGDLCGDEFWELRRAGVELPYQDLLVSHKVGSREECESRCQRNCSCRGALYNNATGICHRMDFSVETLLATGDRNRVGYFKVRNAISTTGGGKEGKKERLVGLVAVLVVGLPVFAGVAMFGAYRMWEYRRRAGGDLVGEGISSGAYKEFRNSGSFREIELSVPSSSSAAPTRRP